ncbi:fused MFS/spermidine synthase [Reinekea sp.]|uniref:spermidine synthase n=1 Tax=Reinekea sp. TaxID=1970455 RepID=UPI00257F0C54|nr:fused MFS/spermidine synthase [Reinekea sp.]
MNNFGKEIKRVYDAIGPVLVYDDGNKRHLSFGDDDEQGCILKHQPTQIQYTYVRAMLLSLLFDAAPNRALLLGLGSGALANLLYHQLPKAHIDVVELRKVVVDLAYSHFQLARHPRLSVGIGDAAAKLAQPVDQPYDLIMSDIYHATGMDAHQSQAAYLERCYRLLAPQGWLVVNFWQEHKQVELLAQLHALFAQVWVNNIDGGNWIVMATNSPELPSDVQLKDNLNDWNERLGFSLTQVAISLCLHR